MAQASGDSLRLFLDKVVLQVGGYRGGNPAHANFVKAPKAPDEGVTPAIAPKQMAALLDAPDADTPAGIRDRAILAVFAYMALRVDELHHIKVGNITRDGEHTVIRIKGKGNDLRRGVSPPRRCWRGSAKARSKRTGVGRCFVPPYRLAGRAAMGLFASR